MNPTLRSLLVGSFALLVVAGCAKSSESTAGASPAPTATMVYSGSTDKSSKEMAGAAASPETVAAVKPGDAEHGKAVFSQNCASCHGASGTEGGAGPSLKGEKAKKDLAAAVAWIKNPTATSGMPKLYPSPLNEKDVIDVATYVESL